MNQRLIIDHLPAEPIEAAREFFFKWLPLAHRMLDAGCNPLIIAFPEAGTDHDDWRRSVTRDLARAHAPVRINSTAGGDADALEEIVRYLGDAPGVTGQYCPAHD